MTRQQWGQGIAPNRAQSTRIVLRTSSLGHGAWSPKRGPVTVISRSFAAEDVNNAAYSSKTQDSVATTTQCCAQTTKRGNRLGDLGVKRFDTRSARAAPSWLTPFRFGARPTMDNRNMKYGAIRNSDEKRRLLTLTLTLTLNAFPNR